MRTTEWRDRVKVVTGQLNRAQTMRWTLDLGALKGVLASLSNDEAVMYFDDTLAIRAIRAIHVRQGEDWVEVAPDQVVTMDCDGELLEFSNPMTRERLDNMPADLADLVYNAVEAENRYVIDRFLSAVTSLMDTQTSSEPGSDSAPSSEV